MKDYDAYLFDWDGTIARTLDFWLVIFKDTLTPYGIQASDKELVRKIAGRAQAGLLELGVPEKDLPAIFAKWDKTAQQQMPLAPLYPDVLEFLTSLHAQGKKLAVITATVRSVMQKVLDEHRLHDVFDLVVTGDEVKAHKPDPEGLLFALDHLGVSKDHAVMFGDSEKDIGAAHNAGIDSVLFYPPEHEALHTLEELQADKPTYTVHSWKEVIDQLPKERA